MLVCHASDLHGDWRPLFKVERKPDVWVFTGDMLYNVKKSLVTGNKRNPSQEAKAQKHDLKQMIPRLRKLLGDTPVVCQDGNHDYICLGEILAAKGFNAISVGLDAQVIPGTEIQVAGFPHVRYMLGVWNREEDEATLCSLANQAMDSNPHWLVTHVPPGSILVSNHTGCNTITSRLMYGDHRVTHHFFGHDHAGRGVEERAGITFSNAATTINWIEA